MLESDFNRINIAISAAKAIVETTDNTDYIGVIAFDNNFYALNYGN